MSSKWLATLTTILAAVAAGLALVPYQWARIVSACLSGALAALHPVNAAVNRVRAKGTNASA